MIQAIKRQYQEDFERINKKFLESHNSQSYTTIHSRIIDEHLKSLWANCNIPGEISLIAVGGYGREELFPYSDIDILILIPNKNTKETNEKVSSFITACWDIGMKIGHSVRTLKDTRFEIHKDIKTTTNLLESRLIKGSKQDFIALSECIRNEINKRQFYIEKLNEQKFLKSKMLLQIHDELIFEVKKSEINKMMNIIKEEMISVANSDYHSFSIPLTVDLNIGDNWGALH